MGYLIFILMLIIGCKSVETVEYLERPTKTKITPNGTIKPGDGPENAKKMKYYNSLQHKKYYKQQNK